MLKFINKLFSLNSASVVQVDSIYPEEEVENSLELNDFELKEYKIKFCSHCKNPSHNISQCIEMNDELKKITDYCSEYKNQTNIPNTRMYLKTLDKNVIYRYVNIKKLKNYMYNNCEDYYKNNCIYGNKYENYIEIIIGYLCVLPLNPSIKAKKVIKYKKQTIIEKHDYVFPRINVVYVYN